ncbi:hypothetical protein ACHAWF_012419 [Thalassiosira exigua]
MSMNIWRSIGDSCHVLSIIVLFRRLKTTNNAQGISLRTQQLRLLVCITRYLDLFTMFYSLYNHVMKIAYIVAYCGVVYLIRCHGQIATTYDEELDNFPCWKFLALPCFLIAMVTHITSTYDRGYDIFSDTQALLWKFSIYLESVSIIPQLTLLRRYRIVENLTVNYVLLLGLYRLFYIFNWIYRSHYRKPGYRHHYMVYFCGVLQTAFYIDFFYHWIISKTRRTEMSYGGEGDVDYYDCDVNELRNYDNSLSLIEDKNIKERKKSGETDDEVGN